MISGVGAVFCFGRPIIQVNAMRKRMRCLCLCVQQILVIQLASWSSVDIIFTYLHILGLTHRSQHISIDIKVNHMSYQQRA
jgi:hypothetical protein